jgi:hypothetical protein
VRQDRGDSMTDQCPAHTTKHDRHFLVLTCQHTHPYLAARPACPAGQFRPTADANCVSEFPDADCWQPVAASLHDGGVLQQPVGCLRSCSGCSTAGSKELLNSNYVGPLETCLRLVGPCACKLLAPHPHPNRCFLHASAGRLIDTCRPILSGPVDAHLTIRIHLLSKPAGCDCNGHGTLQSGQCVCSPGYSGATCLYRIAANTVYWGSDLPNAAPTTTRCQDAQCCAALCDTYPNGGCKAYVWTRTWQGQLKNECWLKSAVPTDIRSTPGEDSGIPEPAPASCPGVLQRLVS